MLNLDIKDVRRDRDKLRKALADLVADLEDRAKWMMFEPDADGKTVPCGNGVYCRAKVALHDTE